MKPRDCWTTISLAPPPDLDVGAIWPAGSGRHTAEKVSSSRTHSSLREKAACRMWSPSFAQGRMVKRFAARWRARAWSSEAVPVRAPGRRQAGLERRTRAAQQVVDRRLAALEHLSNPPRRGSRARRAARAPRVAAVGDVEGRR